MSFADLKVSDDLSMYNSSRQNIIASENGQVNEDWLPKSRITSIKYMLGLLKYFKTFIAGFILPLLLSPLLFSGKDVSLILT